MSLQVGELFAKIDLSTKEFEQGLSKAKMSFTNFGKNLEGQTQKIGQSFKTLGRNMTTYLTLPVAAAGAMALKIGMNYEAAMSNIKALGTPADQMKQMDALALEMGAKTKFSALEAAQGIEELLKAGLTAEQVMGGGLKGALDLAAAGDLELADAATIASTALNAFKKDNLDVTRAANILAGAANASATDVAGLSLGLSQVAAVASGMGMTFEDTATALAIFAQNGLKGSDAGTSFKTMLMNLQPTTKKQVELYERLNLLTEEGNSLFYDEKGRMKSLADISGLLKDRMKNMTDAQRAQALETMFGSDAIRAANILFGEGAEGINNMNAAMGKTTAADVAKEKMNNLKGSIENLTGSLETLAVKIYKTESGPLKALVDGLTWLVNAFGNLPAPVQQVIVIAAGLAAVLGPLLWLIGTIGPVAVATLGTALGVLLGPVGLVIAGITLAIVVFKKLWDTSPGFREWARTVGYSIQNAVTIPVNAAIDVINGLIWALNKLTDWDVPSIKKLQYATKEMAMYDAETMGKSNSGQAGRGSKGLGFGGFASGTNFAPGGWSWVGENGPELLNLPRGSKVMTNSNSMAAVGQGQSLTIGGEVTVKGVNDMGQLVGVAQIVGKEMERGDRRLAGRIRTMPVMP